jgi:hypothetical protein
MQSKAANLTFPYRSGTTDNTPVRYYDCNATSQATAIPSAWYGKFVILTNDSANAAQFFISDDNTSVCDETLAAAANGQPSAQLGGVILGNSSRQARLPYPMSTTTNNGPGVPKTLYLVRASVSAATLRMELAEQ